MKAILVFLILLGCTVVRAEDTSILPDCPPILAEDIAIEALKARIQEQEERLDALAACLPEQRGIERYFMRPNIIILADKKLREARSKKAADACLPPIE